MPLDNQPNPRRSATRPPGARCGRLSGEGFGPLRFEDGSLISAASWSASVVGPFAEVLRQDPSGRRFRIGSTPESQDLARWLHQAEVWLASPIEWDRQPGLTRLHWTEAGEDFHLEVRHPSHFGFELAAWLLQSLPYRLIFSPRLFGLLLRILGPVLGTATRLPRQTSADVPLLFGLQDVQPILTGTLRRNDTEVRMMSPFSSAEATHPAARPLLLQGALLYVPPDLPATGQISTPM